RAIAKTQARGRAEDPEGRKCLASGAAKRETGGAVSPMTRAEALAFSRFVHSSATYPVKAQRPHFRNRAPNGVEDYCSDILKCRVGVLAHRCFYRSAANRGRVRPPYKYPTVEHYYPTRATHDEGRIPIDIEVTRRRARATLFDGSRHYRVIRCRGGENRGMGDRISDRLPAGRARAFCDFGADSGNDRNPQLHFRWIGPRA